MILKKTLPLFFLALISCKSNVMKSSYAVSSATPEATIAGMEIMARGGNAIDAAVAIAFSLGVTEPAMTGLGAGIQILISKSGEEPFMINGTTYSPQVTPVNATEKDIIYHRRSTIPSLVKTLSFAFEKYGSKKVEWTDVLRPAIRLSAEGFEVGAFRAKVYKRYRKQLLESPYNMDQYLVNDSIPKQGDVLKLPTLANTLRQLSERGADDFYHGEIAQQIAEDMKANGGWITLDDLNKFPDPRVLPAIRTSYKDYSVYTSTPPCGGWVVLLALNAMESIAVKKDNEIRYQHLISSLALAHGEREKNPIVDMINFDEEIAEKISKSTATRLLQDKAYEPGSVVPERPGETTHFSVVDKEGTLVSVTTSINAYFGARAASSKLGFIYNSYMEDFIYGDTTHSFAVGPNKMAFSSMSPTVIRDKEGNNVMALGSPGSARIISAVAQTAQYWMDVEQNIVQAVNHARVHVNGSNAYLEFEASDFLKSHLKNSGYNLPTVDDELSINNLNSYFGGVHAVAFENGSWVGAADPRRDGLALSK